MKLVLKSIDCSLYLIFTFGGQIELLIVGDQRQHQVQNEQVEQIIAQHFPHLLKEQIVQDMINAFKCGWILSFYNQLPNVGGDEI